MLSMILMQKPARHPGAPRSAAPTLTPSGMVISYLNILLTTKNNKTVTTVERINYNYLYCSLTMDIVIFETFLWQTDSVVDL